MKSSDNKITAANCENDMSEKTSVKTIPRRVFLQKAGIAAAALGLYQYGCSTSRQAVQTSAQNIPIQGFERAPDAGRSEGWVPISDRKIRVGIVGYGVCKFGADFGFQNHPNVEIVAVSDLFPDRCAALAKVCGCSKTYPSLEELVKDDKIEVVFVATDAPSHAKHVIDVLRHGKHVACCSPGSFRITRRC